MTLQDERIQGAEAKEFLNSRTYKKIMQALKNNVDSQSLIANPDNKEHCQRIIIARQILAGIEREIESIIQYGEVAEIEIKEIESNKFTDKVRRIIR